MRVPPNPCYQCQKRYPCCSVKCLDSQKWHEAFYKRKAEVKTEREADSILLPHKY
jgi:hypothetical protein